MECIYISLHIYTKGLTDTIRLLYRIDFLTSKEGKNARSVAVKGGSDFT